MPAQSIGPDTAALSLARAGMSEPAVESKTRQLGILHEALARLNPDTERASTYFVPGRIEVLGKHVDYAGGRSLTCATEQGICLIATPRDDWRVRMTDPVHKLEASFPLNPELEPLAGDWTNYPMTVARRVARNFPKLGLGKLTGCDIAFTSDLPQAAGLSSSSALIVAVFMAISAINKLHLHPASAAEIKSDFDLAGYLGCIENGSGFGSLTGDRGVGTRGGSQDHTAILCAKAGQLGQFAYRPVELERRVTIPKGYVFVIGVSGVHAVKTGNAQQQYNDAAALAGRAVKLWQKETGRDDEHLAAAVASSPDAAERLRKIIQQAEDAVRVRVEQFLDETYRIVPGAGDALNAGDLDTFGQLTDESQQGAETKLHNQVPQTVFLARSAREHGAAAASAFGAGFGGSVWALIHQDQADKFTLDWSAAYRKAFPDEAKAARFVATRPGPPAMRLG